MIWLALGNQGSGKTIFLVKMAYEYYKKGYKIYSNIFLNFPFEPINYNDVVACKYENAIVLLDEIHLLLPARRSLSKSSVAICDSFLSMVRKKGLIVLGSTQRRRKVDCRFSDEADFIVWCDKFAYMKDKGFIPMAYNNLQLPKNTPSIIRAKICEVSSEKVISNCFLANNYYKLYNTYEIVRVVGLDINKDNRKIKNET